MPHVEIKCFPGRTEEQKMRCAEEVTKAITETMGCDASSVSVAIKEIDKAEWKDKVFDPQIVAEEASLYKKPGYTCD
ncbi:tautomerase family protein [Butyrivibrio sp. AE2032]|uniref:tautomerase family protein n=1 Tax=Butyrivibrio sp. AE2032 TaxID=1458463 RepID=UPI000559510F|nr:tautomerase family protein [Butyrivibrio sp. AE2032]